MRVGAQCISADVPHQVQPLNIIGGKVDHMTNRDLSDGHLTQSQHLEDGTKCYKLSTCLSLQCHRKLFNQEPRLSGEAIRKLTFSLSLFRFFDSFLPPFSFHIPPVFSLEIANQVVQRCKLP